MVNQDKLEWDLPDCAIDPVKRKEWFENLPARGAAADSPPRDWLYLKLAKGAVDLASIGRGMTAGALFLRAGRVYASELYCVECLHPRQVGGAPCGR